MCTLWSIIVNQYTIHLLFAKIYGIICMTNCHYSNIKESEVLIILKNRKCVS